MFDVLGTGEVTFEAELRWAMRDLVSSMAKSHLKPSMGSICKYFGAIFVVEATLIAEFGWAWRSLLVFITARSYGKS